MAAKKVTVGELIKEARTNKGFSQQYLADQIDGLSASDISKAERGEKMLTNDQLKAIAKATGVTQKSLLEAAAGTSTSGKTGSTSGKTGSSSSGKTSSSSSSSGTTMKVTAAEKRLVELYRKADTETKKSVMKTLKGDDDDLGELLSSVLGGDTGEIINNVLGQAMNTFLKK